jgi:hypothetical protein
VRSEEGRLEEKRGEARHEAKRKSFCSQFGTTYYFYLYALSYCAYSAHSECPHDDDDYLFYT